MKTLHISGVERVTYSKRITVEDGEFAKLKARLERGDEEQRNEILFEWIDRAMDAQDGGIESADLYEIVPGKDPKKPKLVPVL